MTRRAAVVVATACLAVIHGNAFVLPPPGCAGGEGGVNRGASAMPDPARDCGSLVQQQRQQPHLLGGQRYGGGQRRSLVRMRESVRSRIDKVKKKLRKAKNEGDSVEEAKLRQTLAGLRAQDPLFSREDQYKAAVLEGRFAAAAKLKLTIDKMKQENPFRPPAEDGHDMAEDMSWGFDSTFHKPQLEDDTPEGWMDI